MNPLYNQAKIFSNTRSYSFHSAKQNTKREVSKRKGIQEQLENHIDQGFEVATMSENRK